MRKPTIKQFFFVYGVVWVSLDAFTGANCPNHLIGISIGNLIMASVNIFVGIPLARIGWVPWRDKP